MVQITNEGTYILSTSNLGLHYVANGGIRFSSIIGQRLQKAPAPPSTGNLMSTNDPVPSIIN